MWHLFCFKPMQSLNLKYTILQLPKDTAPTQCIGWLNTPAKPERYNHSFRLVFEQKHYIQQFVLGTVSLS